VNILTFLLYSESIDIIQEIGNISRKFVFPPDEAPPLLWEIYAFILVMVCISLILIIRSTFQFSMNARMHQLGILQSIGATPKQLRLQ